ncbi:MAG: transketolase [Solirubrobacterales bacterium]
METTDRRQRDELTIRALEKTARRIRCDIVNMLTEANSGHPGGSLSAADIVTALYFWEMRVDPSRPDWEERDRFVLSKGHAVPVLYAALAEKGFIERDLLPSLRKLGSPLQGHPDMRKCPGVEASTGSLGQGIGWALGMALGLQQDQRDARVYVLLGDGELQEGLVWEAVMAAAHYRLDNLVAFVDCNGLQIDGPTEKVLSPNPIGPKFVAFNWHTIVIDGHDMLQITAALDEARRTKGRPTAIIARTTKGKGVSFMEDQADWHGKAPSKEQRDQAMTELTK